MIEKDPKTGLWRHPQPVSRDSLNNTEEMIDNFVAECERCLLYTSPSPRDRTRSRMPSSA